MTRPLFAFAAALLLAAGGCTCDGPSVGGATFCEANTVSTCAACPAGCTSADTCDDAAEAWACACTCAVNEQNFCQTLAERACSFATRCHSEPVVFGGDLTEGRGGTPPLANTDQVATTEQARCVASLAHDPACIRRLEGFKAHRADLDATALSACIAAAYPPDTCGRDFNAVQTKCLTTPLIVPAVAVDGLCTADVECAQGWCDVASGAACGVCRAYVARTAACTRDAQCDRATQYCAGALTGTGGTCANYRAEDASCSLPDQQSCGAGHVCGIGSGQFPFPRCLVGKAAGAACAIDKYECLRSGRALPELLCAPVTIGSSTSNLCVKLQTASGGPCGGGEVAIPTGFDGTSLTGVRGPLCPETEFCASGTCVPRRTATQACEGDEACAAGLRCLDQAGVKTCQPYQDLGGSCGSDQDCKNLLKCAAGGTCQPGLALNGEQCSTERTCAEGHCDPGIHPVCSALKASGAACGAAEECSSASCAVTCQPVCWGDPAP